MGCICICIYSLLYLASFTQHNVLRFILLVCLSCLLFILVEEYYIHFVYPFASWWAFRLFSVWGWVVLLCTFTSKCLRGHMISFLFDGSQEYNCWVVGKLMPNWFLKWLYHFTSPPAKYKVLVFLHLHQHFVLFVFLIIAISVGV